MTGQLRKRLVSLFPLHFNFQDVHTQLNLAYD